MIGCLTETTSSVVAKSLVFIMVHLILSSYEWCNSNSGQTPLFLATWSGKFDTCEVLLELEADHNIARHDGIHFISTYKSRSSQISSVY